MTTEEFDKEFTFVYNCMKLDLNAYKQNIQEMEEKEKTVYLFFQKHPESLIEWREWFLGN
jgi:GTPase SAR1 family protein